MEIIPNICFQNRRICVKNFFQNRLFSYSLFKTLSLHFKSRHVYVRVCVSIFPGAVCCQKAAKNLQISGETYHVRGSETRHCNDVSFPTDSMQSVLSNSSEDFIKNRNRQSDFKIVMETQRS